MDHEVVARLKMKCESEWDNIWGGGGGEREIQKDYAASLTSHVSDSE